MDDSMVLVLLATYNGQNYIRQMVDSVLAQDYENIRIVLSDDGSRDDTVSILKEYAEKEPQKVTHYQSGQRFGCAQKHFMHLLRTFHDAPYIMFCDQDDVWHPDKISKTLQKMKQTERSAHVPAMVHTDLRVVDGELAQIAPSFCAHSNLDGTRLKMHQLLVQNVVTGCTMMVNRPLAELACRAFAEDAMLMHDWWLAILASAVGQTGFLDEATIDYRQHGNNSVGAKNVRSIKYLITRLKTKKMRKSLMDGAKQAQAFLACYEDLLNPEQIALLKAFSSTRNASVFARDYIYIKYKLLKYGFVRVMAQLLGW